VKSGKQLQQLAIFGLKAPAAEHLEHNSAWPVHKFGGIVGFAQQSSVRFGTLLLDHALQEEQRQPIIK
jgi:hypothetical protein